MRFPPGKSFEAVEEGLIDLLGTELIDEMIVIDAHLFAIIEKKMKQKKGKCVNTGY